LWETEDALREEESPRHQDHYQKERDLKLEETMFPNAIFCFSNARLVPLVMG
jgi:hypothetical protein